MKDEKQESRSHIIVLYVLLSIIIISAIPIIAYFTRLFCYRISQDILVEKLNITCDTLKNDLTDDIKSLQLEITEEGHTLSIRREKDPDLRILYRYARRGDRNMIGVLTRAVIEKSNIIEESTVSDMVEEFKALKEGEHLRIVVQVKDFPAGKGSPALILSRTLTF